MMEIKYVLETLTKTCVRVTTYIYARYFSVLAARVYNFSVCFIFCIFVLFILFGSKTNSKFIQSFFYFLFIQFYIFFIICSFGLFGIFFLLLLFPYVCVLYVMMSGLLTNFLVFCF